MDYTAGLVCLSGYFLCDGNSSQFWGREINAGIVRADAEGISDNQHK